MIKYTTEFLREVNGLSSNESNLTIKFSPISNKLTVQGKSLGYQIRGEVLSYILRCIDVLNTRQVTNLCIEGLDVIGKVNLDYIDFTFNLSFTDCQFRQDLSFRYANLFKLKFERCYFETLIAHHLTTTNNFQLKECSAIYVDIDFTRIGASLYVEDTSLKHDMDSVSISLDRAKIGADIDFSNTHFSGRVNAIGVRVEGQFRIENCRLEFGTSVDRICGNLEGVSIGSDFFLTETCVIGVLTLEGSRITNTVEIEKVKTEKLYSCKLNFSDCVIGDRMRIRRIIKKPVDSVEFNLSPSTVKVFEDDRSIMHVKMQIEGFYFQRFAHVEHTILDKYYRMLWPISNSQIRLSNVERRKIRVLSACMNRYSRFRKSKGRLDRLALLALSIFYRFRVYNCIGDLLRKPNVDSLQGTMDRTGNCYEGMGFIESGKYFHYTRDKVFASSFSFFDDPVRKAKLFFLQKTTGLGWKPSFVFFWSVLIILGYSMLISASMNCNWLVQISSVQINSSFDLTPLLFSVDNFLPLVNLEIASNWQLTSAAPPFAVFLLAIEILVGWILTTMLIAALAGLIKRD